MAVEHQRLRVPLTPPLRPVLRIRMHTGNVPPRRTHRSPHRRTRRLRCGTAQAPALKWEPPAQRPGQSPWETHHHHITTAWGLGSFRGRRRQAATSESQNRRKRSRPEQGAVSPLCISLTPPGSCAAEQPRCRIAVCRDLCASRSGPGPRIPQAQRPPGLAFPLPAAPPRRHGDCGISPGWAYLGDEEASVLEILNQDRFPALSEVAILHCQKS